MDSASQTKSWSSARRRFSPTTRSTSSTRPAPPASPRARRCRTTTCSTTRTSSHARCTTPSATASCVPVPFYHCFGMVLGNLACATHGACMVVPGEAFDRPRPCSRRSQAERCTSLYGVPTMFIAELEHPEFDSFDLRSLRTGMMGGAPCPVEVMKQVRSRMHMSEVTIVCGMTETSPVSTQTAVDDPVEKRVTHRRPRPPARRDQDHRSRHRRRRAARDPRRAVHPRLQRDARLLGRSRRDPRTRSTPTAGCTPATSR